MTFMQYESKLVPKYKLAEKTSYNINHNNSLINNNRTTTIGTVDLIAIGNKTYEKEFDYWQALPSERYGINVLGLVMFCLVFGYTISAMNEQGKILLRFFEAVNEASIRMINIVM